MLWITDMSINIYSIVMSLSSLALFIFIVHRDKNKEAKSMCWYYRNFYMSSESDMRELEVVEKYVNKIDLENTKTTNNILGIISLSVKTVSEIDILFLRNYCFTEE